MATLRHVLKVIHTPRSIGPQVFVLINLQHGSKIPCFEKKVIFSFPKTEIQSSVHITSSRLFTSSGEQKTPQVEDDSKTQCLTFGANPFDPSVVENLLNTMEGDLPVSDMPNPYAKEYRRCFLCKQNVHLDHKNVRLLSQFVSPYTGRIYGRAVTGLCIPMQKHVSNLIKRSRNSGYMPVLLKDPKYLRDPQPYDAMSKKF
ncbi:unnamed protein product [Lymnaea stagnalis]|uniref:Mitochondrial ribosomal protein S18C n=1 Tax=Lymnaea stagnalis TaxID=6523 RepID=A0AAV2HXG7_LYMST